MKSCINKLRPVFISLSYRPSASSNSIPLLRAGLVALFGSLISLPALSDTLTPFVGASINHEDNLLRLSNDQLKLVDGGSDTYRSLIAGLSIERPFGRQLISASADLSSVSFDRFSQLNFTGRDARAEWRWFVAKHFDGHIGASYALALAPFSDFHSTQRNLRVTKKLYVDGNWRFHPSWQWHNSYTKDTYNYDLGSGQDQVNNRTEEALTTGIDYLAASGSTVGLQLRHVKGGYPFQQTQDVRFAGNDYIQDEAKLNAFWLATGTTQVSFVGGWVRRKQNALIERVDSGNNARLIVNWAPLQKVKLTGQAWREFAAIDGTLVDNALVTGSSAGATWDLTGKIQMLADIKHEKRLFTPSGSTGRSFSSDALTDSSNSASTGLVYKPVRGLLLKLSAFSERRAGSLAAGSNSYTAKGVSLTAGEQF